jgi:hypothetical protein
LYKTYDIPDGDRSGKYKKTSENSFLRSVLAPALHLILLLKFGPDEIQGPQFK